MKFGDLTLRQIFEICEQHRKGCESCPFWKEIVNPYLDETHTCLAGLTTFGFRPRGWNWERFYVEVKDVAADGIARCADCVHAEVYGCHVIFRRAYGLNLGLDSFCSEGVKRP